MPLVRSLAVLLTTSVLVLPAGAEELVPSQVKPGEAIRITYVSRGCFNNDHWFFEWSGESLPSVRFQNADERATPRAGTLELNRKELLGLDLLLRFYRARPSGGCTTEDSITAEYFRGEALVGREEFKDDSCLLDMSGVVAPTHFPPGIDRELLEKVTTLQSLMLKAEATGGTRAK